MKLGFHENSKSRVKVAYLLRGHTFKSGDGQIGLKEYVYRMKEGQNDIYYLHRRARRPGVLVAVLGGLPRREHADEGRHDGTWMGAVVVTK
eukprot:1551681-Heterocapsa_arctica.AAC.1